MKCRICWTDLESGKCPIHGGRLKRWIRWNEGAIASLMLITAILAILISIPFLSIYVEQYRNSIPVRVIVDDRVVFTGPSWAAKVESSGATTSVTILEFSWMQYWPKERYVSNNVRVENQ